MEDTQFQSFVHSGDSCKPILPNIHTCDGRAFRKIIEDGELAPSPCTVYTNESLVYFFYGKPSYRSGMVSSSSFGAFFPVCLILRPETVKPHRILPFDSGAYSNKLFDDHFHPGMKCEDFLLKPMPDEPSRLVSLFYGDNYSYYHGKPSRPIHTSFDFEVECYADLISSKRKSLHDDRRSAIEIQTQDSVFLDQERIEAIVLPHVFHEHPNVMARIKEWRVNVEAYAIHHGSPKEYVGICYNLVERYLDSKGYFG